MAINSNNPLINGLGRNNSPSVTPQEWEYMQNLRKNNNWQEQQSQPQNNSDPYLDFENEFHKCSPVMQQRILQDEEFINSMQNCDKIIQSAVETIVRPQVIQTPEGRLAFERLLGSFRTIRDKYTKEELVNMEKFQRIMNDDIVKQRLAELEGGGSADDK